MLPPEPLQLWGRLPARLPGTGALGLQVSMSLCNPGSRVLWAELECNHMLGSWKRSCSEAYPGVTGCHRVSQGVCWTCHIMGWWVIMRRHGLDMKRMLGCMPCCARCKQSHAWLRTPITQALAVQAIQVQPG